MDRLLRPSAAAGLVIAIAFIALLVGFGGGAVSLRSPRQRRCGPAWMEAMPQHRLAERGTQG